MYVFAIYRSLDKSEQKEASSSLPVLLDVCQAVHASLEGHPHAVHHDSNVTPCEDAEFC